MNKGKEIMPTYVPQYGSNVLTSKEKPKPKPKQMERGEMSETPCDKVLSHGPREYHHKGNGGNCPRPPPGDSVDLRRMSFVDFERDRRDMMRKKRLVGEHIEDLKREIKRLKRPFPKRDKGKCQELKEKPRGFVDQVKEIVYKIVNRMKK